MGFGAQLMATVMGMTPVTSTQVTHAARSAAITDGDSSASRPPARRLTRGAAATRINSGFIDDLDRNAAVRGPKWYGEPSRMGIADRMVRDPQVRASVYYVRDALMAAKWRFKPASKSVIDREAADYVNWALIERLPWRSFLGRMVGGYPALQLIVHPHFAIGQVPTAGNLNAIHTQVRASQPGPVGIFGIDLRQGNVRPAVVGPRFQLWQLIDRRLIGQDRTAAHPARSGVPCGDRRLQIQRRPSKQVGGIDLERDQPFEPGQRVAEQIADPFDGAEQIAEHRKAAAPHIGEQDGRPARAEHTTLDLRRFKVRIDRMIDRNQLARPL